MNRFLILFLFFIIRTGIAEDRYLIDDVADVQIHGCRDADEIGRYPIGSGNYNGDGIDDFIIGTDMTTGVNPQIYAHIVFGATDLPKEIDLRESRLATSERQVFITGFLSSKAKGTNLGDFNGDGYDDMFFGDSAATIEGLTAAGQAYIKYGGPAIPGKFNLDDATMEGVHIIGSRFYGWLCSEIALRGVDDINGDGFDDVVLGAPNYGISGDHGEAFLIYGGTDVPEELRTHELGPHGVWIEATEPEDGFGWAMDGVGDVNRDGLNDFVVSSWGALEKQGYAYLIFGATDLPEKMWTGFLGKYGVRIKGAGPGDLFGYKVSAAGDVNRDGYADFLVAAMGYDPGGRVYLFFGSPQWPEYLDADNMGNRGVIIQGTEGLNSVGISLAPAGDFNGDGWDDILIGARDTRISLQLRQVSVVYGGPNLTGRLRGVLDEYDQTIIESDNGSYIWFNTSLMLLGDVNGDDIRDIAIGAMWAEPYGRGGAGTVYVIYGGKFWNQSPTPTPTSTLTPTVSPSPVVTLTPTPTHQETGKFSGWILSGDGKIKVTSKPTPEKVK